MFFRLLFESFRHQRRRKLLAGIAILLGTTAVTAMLALATTIGDRIHAELAVYGANILVTPQAAALAVNIGDINIQPAGNAYLRESDLAKLRTIFWANNITAISPDLPLTLSADTTPPATKPSALPSAQSYRAKVEVSSANANVRTPLPQPTTIPARGLWFNHNLAGLNTGASSLHPLWKLTGAWPSIPSQAVLGSTLAARLNLRIGETIYVSDTQAKSSAATARIPLEITGVVQSAGDADNQLLLPLATAQLLNNTPDAVSRVEISARTRPEDAFARQNPETLSPKERDTWYCRPYANSIAYQVREVIPNADAQQVRRVEQSEGNVLKRISGLMALISAAALFAAGFAVSAAMATAVLERRAEIGLMRSLGASKGSIALLFYVEAGILALAAGTIGYLAGSALAAALGARIFSGTGAPIPILNPVLLPITAGLALLVAIAGSTPAIRSALKLDPSSILRSNA